jgi:hypothetical protein
MRLVASGTSFLLSVLMSDPGPEIVYSPTREALLRSFAPSYDLRWMRAHAVASANVARLKHGEINKEVDPATFLDSSFIAAANDWTTDDVKKNLNAWKEANSDKLIN